MIQESTERLSCMRYQDRLTSLPFHNRAQRAPVGFSHSLLRLGSNLAHVENIRKASQFETSRKPAGLLSS
jgi:hypothetical protein